MINPLTSKNDKLIAIGQISVYFGLLILTVRHVCIYPAHHYKVLALILLIGFLPSLLYKLFPSRISPYFLVGNALLLVSTVFVLLEEWALAGVFVLVPVFALLFRERRIYLVSAFFSLICNIGLALIFLYRTGQTSKQLVTLLDVLTVFLILVFIIYFVVMDLRGSYMEEARHMQTIQTLSQSVEAKDPYTKGHSERVAKLGKMLAERIPDLNADTVYLSGLIHDVGKLSVPDHILLKKTRLTDEETRMMRSHPVNGAKLCQNLNIHKEIVLGVLHHHERWDGEGYPFALKGEHIPMIGRVLGVADAIDAMCTKRAYRNAMEPEAVISELKKCQGTHFDPSIIRIVWDKWPDIHRFYRSDSCSD